MSTDAGPVRPLNLLPIAPYEWAHAVQNEAGAMVVAPLSSQNPTPSSPERPAKVRARLQADRVWRKAWRSQGFAAGRGYLLRRWPGSVLRDHDRLWESGS